MVISATVVADLSVNLLLRMLISFFISLLISSVLLTFVRCTTRHSSEYTYAESSAKRRLTSGISISMSTCIESASWGDRSRLKKKSIGDLAAFLKVSVRSMSDFIEKTMFPRRDKSAESRKISRTGRPTRIAYLAAVKFGSCSPAL